LAIRKTQHRQKHIGKVLKAARMRQHLTAEEVGHRCNVSRSRVYQWEAERYVFPKNLPMLALALHLSLKRLQAENVLH
jgi:transcriptional regulator with XRE-family HTH domain